MMMKNPTKTKTDFGVIHKKYYSQRYYRYGQSVAVDNSLSNPKWRVLGHAHSKVFELSSYEYSQYLRVSKQTSYLGSSHSFSPQCGEEAWFIKYLRKLTEFSRLSQNWDSHDAEPPNAIAINHAKRILSILVRMNFPPSHVTPSVENGVGISFIRGNKYADIECFNTGEILAVTSTGNGDPTVWEVENNSAAIRLTVRKIRDFIRR
jgi:hypothetical protein